MHQRATVDMTITGKHQTFPGSFLEISPYFFFRKCFRMCTERLINPLKISNTWNWSHTTITFMLWKSYVFYSLLISYGLPGIKIGCIFYVLRFICALNEIQFPLWEASHILTSARRVSFPPHRSLKLRRSHISCQTAKLRWVTCQRTECECECECESVYHMLC